MNAKERTRQLILLRHRGASWKHCAEQLGKSVEYLRKLSVKLRDSGQWRINGQPARNASVAGLSGAPIGRPRVDSASVNVRLPIDVVAALHEVAKQNDLRLGEVISEAMVPTRKLSYKVRRVSLGPPRKNVNVKVPQSIADAFGGTGVAVAAACEKLLRELGCEVSV